MRSFGKKLIRAGHFYLKYVKNFTWLPIRLQVSSPERIFENEFDVLYGRVAMAKARSLSDLGLNLLREWQIGPYSRKFSTNRSTISSQISGNLSRFSILSLRFPKSDRLLIWLSVVKQNKVFPSTFEVAMLFQYFQGICRGRTCVATFDRSDIRGLFTARPVFIAELPLSSSGSSVNLIP